MKHYGCLLLDDDSCLLTMRMTDEGQFYLFFLCAVQVSPLLDGLRQVQGVHGNLHLTDHIVLREAVKVVHRHDQSLSSHFIERNLEINISS